MKAFQIPNICTYSVGFSISFRRIADMGARWVNGVFVHQFLVEIGGHVSNDPHVF